MPYYSELGIYTPSSSYTSPLLKGPYSSHSSIIASNILPPSSKQFTRSNFRGYKPHLMTISESSTVPLRRINSPKLVYHSSPKVRVQRPIKINTADIDVSLNRYKKYSPQTKPPRSSTDSKSPSPQKEVKPPAELKEAKPNSVIRRDRATIRLQTIHKDALEKEIGVIKSWRDNFKPEELVTEAKRQRKTPGEILKDKFLIRSKSKENIAKLELPKLTRRVSIKKSASFKDICNEITSDTAVEDLNPGQPLEVRRRQSRQISHDEILRELQRSSSTLSVEEVQILDALLQAENEVGLYDVPPTIEEHPKSARKKKATKKKSAEMLQVDDQNQQKNESSTAETDSSDVPNDNLTKIPIKRKSILKKPIRKSSSEISIPETAITSNSRLRKDSSLKDMVKDISQVEIETVPVKPKAPVITASVGDIEEKIKNSLKLVVEDMDIQESPKAEKKFRFNVTVQEFPVKKTISMPKFELSKNSYGCARLPSSQIPVIVSILKKKERNLIGTTLGNGKVLKRKEAKKLLLKSSSEVQVRKRDDNQIQKSDSNDSMISNFTVTVNRAKSDDTMFSKGDKSGGTNGKLRIVSVEKENTLGKIESTVDKVIPKVETVTKIPNPKGEDCKVDALIKSAKKELKTDTFLAKTDVKKDNKISKWSERFKKPETKSLVDERGEINDTSCALVGTTSSVSENESSTSDSLEQIKIETTKETSTTNREAKKIDLLAGLKSISTDKEKEHPLNDLNSDKAKQELSKKTLTKLSNELKKEESRSKHNVEVNDVNKNKPSAGMKSINIDNEQEFQLSDLESDRMKQEHNTTALPYVNEVRKEEKQSKDENDNQIDIWGNQDDDIYEPPKLNKLKLELKDPKAILNEIQESHKDFGPIEPETPEEKEKRIMSKRSLIHKANKDDPDLKVFEPPTPPTPEPVKEPSPEPSFVPLQSNRLSQWLEPRKKPEQREESIEIFAKPKFIRARHIPRRWQQNVEENHSEDSTTSEEDSSSEESGDESEEESEEEQILVAESKIGASTSSNDSGFESGRAKTNECDVNCHKKCQKLMPNLCGINQKLVVEAIENVRKGSIDSRDSPGNTLNPASNPAFALDFNDLPEEVSQSSTYQSFQRSGRITPPATTIPRFRKYCVDDFNFLKVLGKGSFGKVLLAELKETEYYYAIKCLKKDVVLEDDDVECTLIERKVLALGTKHPYLCHLLCTFQTESHLFFVMEYLNGGDLMFHIQVERRFSESRARFYGAEIVSGLKFLHNKGIVYRDLKLDNILLDFDGHVRIADFGMCKLQIFLDRMADTFCGTPDYMAPEIIKGQHYNQCVDWWSFGVLLYEMLLGQSPFSGCDEDELFWSICNEKPVIPRFLSAEASSVLTQFLEKDANKRLGNRFSPHGDIQDHPFFKPIDWTALENRQLEPPFKPNLQHPLDTQYFDKTFTTERAKLTPIESGILQSMDQTQFQGFSYTNPNATDK